MQKEQKKLKILYGVSGEGSGHSSRAKLIGQHLVTCGHELKIVSYDRGVKNLCAEFDVFDIIGLSITSIDNKVSMFKTVLDNLAKLPKAIPAFKKLKALFKTFQPDVVITDFEPCTAYLASHFKLPLISIDNQHRMRYMEYQRPKGLRIDAFITETIIRSMVPKPWYSLITSFHQGPLKNNHCAVFAPLLRPNILGVQASEGEHILVYATSGFDSVLDYLRQFRREQFRVYGCGLQGEEDNLCFLPFSQEGFLSDLASAKAVIATGGFTLISEALYLRKPQLVLPMKGQFEQELNAFILEDQGLGRQCVSPSYKDFAAFLYDLPDIKHALQDYPGFGNDALLTKLDQLVANDLAELKRYRP